jgi:hypothetical protein
MCFGPPSAWLLTLNIVVTMTVTMIERGRQTPTRVKDCIETRVDVPAASCVGFTDVAFAVAAGGVVGWPCTRICSVPAA